MLIRIAWSCSIPVKAALVNWLPWMPFCLSSGDWKLIDLASALADEGEYLTCDVAFDAANGFEFGVAFSDAFGDVGLGPGIGPQTADGNDMQSAIGGAIATAIQAMAGRLTGGGRDWTDPAKGSKACFGMQAFSVVAGCQ